MSNRIQQNFVCWTRKNTLFDSSSPPHFYSFYTSALKSCMPLCDSYLNRFLFFSWFRVFSFTHSFGHMFISVVSCLQFCHCLELLDSFGFLCTVFIYLFCSQTLVLKGLSIISVAKRSHVLSIFWLLYRRRTLTLLLFEGAANSVAFLSCFYKHLISSYFTDLDDEDLNEETSEFIRSLPTSGLEGSMVFWLFHAPQTL